MNVLMFVLLSVLGLLLGGGALFALLLRRVVSTNEVHIVQTAKKTTSYGKDMGNGNTYYEWPSWLPVLGVTKIVLPVSVFDLDLVAYEAYDKGRLPFIVDVKAFFRITDSNVAAQRVSSVQELMNQLKAVVQGAIRVILASNDIEEILQGRSKFGDEFTKEVEHQLVNWGVNTVKNIELMDIRDGKDSHVIRSIMEKKKSHIDMESRSEVAKNKKTAEIAEIDAQREVDLQAQQARQSVGLRTIEAERAVELELQAKTQAIKTEEKNTREREMDVVRVEQVRRAEIDRDVQLTKAEQDKQFAVLIADGQLEVKTREAKAVSLEGQARADAEKAMQLAPVQAQITLAQEIGQNAEYQKYLIMVRRIEADQAVGLQQAKALEVATIKIIANAGSPVDGVKNVMDLFTAKGGLNIGAALEGFAQTDEGRKLLDAVSPSSSVE